MLKRFLGTVALIAIPFAAHAADAVVDEVVVVEDAGYNWSGVYIGGLVGYGWGQKDAFDAEEPDDRGAYDVDGFLGGIEVGANWQFDQFLLGAEADVTWSGMDGNGLIDNDDPISTDIDLLATITGRVGYVWDRTLLYFEAGGAWVSEDHSWDVGTSAETVSGDQWGYVVGAGVEYAINEHWSLKGEYNYVDFGSEVYLFPIGDEQVDIDQSMSTVKLGLNYRF